VKPCRAKTGEQQMNETIASILSGKRAFCLIQKQDSEEILLLLGTAKQFDFLKDITRKKGPAGDRRHYDTISVIPFCQIKERGFEVHDQGEKICTIEIEEQMTMFGGDLLRLLPDTPIELNGALQYDTTEDEYAEIISKIVVDEIGEGEGANFVIPRSGKGSIAGFTVASACSLFSTLVREDYGTYWKFLFYNTSRFFIGSTPERHLQVEKNRVKMNPISGTFRKDIAYECRSHFKDELLLFLNDQKEINELFMVVDEELKMMARMCSEGGSIVGPLLKEMSQLIHSEYLLSGISNKDIFDLFLDSMFAATVVGSPVENACRIIKKYSENSRGYYGSGLMLVGRDPDGSDYLDSPITIRTLEIDNDGHFNFSTGATLVKDSLPAEEVRETAAKSRAILRPLLTKSSRKVVLPLLPGLHNDDDIIETLSRRNQDLSNFWFFKQERINDFSPNVDEISLTLIDNGDDFIYMLRHIFNSLGICTTIVKYQDYEVGKDLADITLLGPGPGNPNNESDEKIIKNMAITAALLSSGKKALFICLGHQILCRCLGYTVQKKEKPLQGSQLEIDLFGDKEKVGFYNTFAARRVPGDNRHACATLGESNELVAIKGERFIGYQFHPESILTKNGFVILQQALVHLL
jgi:phenazine biosynthesis protein phzE